MWTMAGRVTAREAAEYLARTAEGIDEPTGIDVARWESMIRVWAYRRTVHAYGSARQRRYDLVELWQAAQRWHARPRARSTSLSDHRHGTDA